MQKHRLIIQFKGIHFLKLQKKPATVLLKMNSFTGRRLWLFKCSKTKLKKNYIFKKKICMIFTKSFFLFSKKVICLK